MNDTVKNKLFHCDMIMVGAVKPFVLGALLFFSDYLIQRSDDLVHLAQRLLLSTNKSCNRSYHCHNIRLQSDYCHIVALLFDLD